MYPLKTTILAMTTASLLAGSSLCAWAETGAGRPVAGLAVTGPVDMTRLPSEVEGGSIEIRSEDEQDMAARARITADEALAIAGKAVPGRVVAISLENEGGYLVWETEVLQDRDPHQGEESELMIDAGNGRLLAMTSARDNEDDEVDHDESWHWRFWEERDGHGRQDDD